MDAAEPGADRRLPEDLFEPRTILAAVGYRAAARKRR